MKKVIDVPLSPGLDWTFLVKGRKILVMLRQTPPGLRPLIARTITARKALEVATLIEELQVARTDHLTVGDLGFTRGKAQFLTIPTEFEDQLRRAFDCAVYCAIVYGD